MQRVVWLVIASATLSTLAPATCDAQDPAVADPGGQVARFLKVDLADHLAAAPQPRLLPAEFKLRLVDYIDCTNPKDPHPFLDDGLSRIFDTPVGTYRETGPAGNSYFAWRFRVAEAGRAHVVVLEFPDDAERITAIALAQPPTGNVDKPAARVEFGYRTGDLLPVSGRMLTRWTFFFPTSAEPAALVVASWHARARGALARAWIYAVEDEKLPAAGGEGSRYMRSAGWYLGDPHAIGTRFGGRAGNLVQVMDYLGTNEVAFDAMRDRRFYYPSARFSVEDGTIPDLLDAMAEGSKRMVAVFDPDCTVGTFSMPGAEENVADIGEAQARKVWQEFVQWDFLRPFGESPALVGLMFGGPRGSAAFDLRSSSGQTDFVTDIARLLAREYRSLRVYQNLAAPAPGVHYFQEPGTDWGPLGRWEISEKPMDRCLADRVLDTWRAYGLDEEELADNDQLVLLRQCDRDDAARYRFGHQPVPRYWLLDAAAESAAVTNLMAGAKLSGIVLSSTPARRMLLLRPPHFWWPYVEMSPTLAPAGPQYFVPAARAVAAGLEPYTLWLAEGNGAAALHEEEVRQWLDVMRSVPFRSFAPLEGAATFPVTVRTYAYGASLYVVMVNVSQSPAEVTLNFDGETALSLFGGAATGRLTSHMFRLPPGGIAAFSTGASSTIESVRQESPAAVARLTQTLAAFAADLAAAKAAKIAMAPRYDSTLVAAREALAKGDLAEADRLLHPAAVREPGFRVRVATDRPGARVGRAPTVTIDGRLDEWRDVEPIRLETVEHVAWNDHAANHWKGPDDLSAALWLGWKDDGLCFALKVTDDRATDDENESSTLGMSASGYRSWSSRPGYDFLLHLPRREDSKEANLVTLRDGALTIHEGFIPAAELGARLAPAAGRTVGLNLIVNDSDDRTGMPYAWCKSNVLVWSNRQDGYQYWSDAQTCGEITFRQ